MFTFIGRKSNELITVDSLADMQEMLITGELDAANCPTPPTANSPWCPTWAGLFPPPGHTIPPPGLKKTAPFCTVYEGVTKEMRYYYSRHADAKLFLEFLIHNFYQEYECWSKAGSFPQTYLARWHQKADGKAYGLIGHAYLHIAWDLPRCVAECFPFGTTQKLQITEKEASYHFTQTNDIFGDVFNANMKKFAVAGVLALPGKLFNKRSALVRLGTYWIVAVRMTAWNLGCYMAEQPKSVRDTLEAKLRASVQREALNAIGSNLNPIAWAGLVKQPSFMLSIVSFVLLPAVVPQRFGVGLNLLYEALVLLIGFCLYFFGVYRGTVHVAKTLGASLQESMQRLIDELPTRVNDESSERIDL